ncbi:hypothetical protein H7J87_24255 [Mycolicibacterium wolinskyi]|uniref:Histidine kinase n=1 Tax=Mycolicibacterium wolinskyi TaxID=59750 RepID=A0A1X2F007_9MYCO|nr:MULTISPECIES: hypothetical protein [Mycolicibacterium]MCV7288442.1 hypothetical protein [Mycolicibacterium wolinskyi]MCV7295664.1 hypothetical protein [Mycolicibacterium goodii]ORX11688.1 histidine kinase [Mycolicibacterium wolinskyi]
MSTASPAAERVDRVVEAVTAVDGVIGLHFGPGVPETHLPGRTVRGIRLGADRGQVHVVLELRAGLLDTADRVRDAASTAARVPVDVVVGDVTAVP